MLEKTIAHIEELDHRAQKEAQNRLDNLTKPPGSLGKLEKIVVQLAGITGKVLPEVNNKTHIVMVADHGIVEEGVSAFPQNVTQKMVKNFINGGAAINVLSEQIGADLKVVDIGMKSDVPNKEVLSRKVKRGTDNFARGPAMSKKEALTALETGIEITQKCINQGCNLIGTGEMGIGNTSPSSAILAALTDFDLQEIVGPGTGLDPEKVKQKAEIIARGLEVNQPDPHEALDVLAKVGGLEIAGMAGCMLGAAAGRTPVLIDGFISGAAALIAYKLEPGVSDYLIPSHISAEPGHIKIYELLGLNPYLDLEMRLGEGTGAVLAMGIVESATKIIREMATFSEAGIKK